VSKFGAIVQRRKQDKSEGVKPEPEPEQNRGPKRMGRPPGKRSNPEYEQVTSYIRRDTYQAVQVALIQSGKKRQYSELVQELLERWLEKEGV
jgi:hypothetical protein